MAQTVYRPLEDAAAAADEQKNPRLYLNIFVAQKTEEMNKMIQEKIDEKVPNPLGFGVLRRAAGRIAVKKLSTDKIAAKLAERIPEVMPTRLSEMGVQADVEEVYRKGSFVVLHITILNSDVHTLLLQKAGEEKASKADRVLECLKSLARCLGKEAVFENKVQSTLNAKIVDGMCQKLPEVLPEKMAEKGLIVDVVAKSEAAEATFLFEALKHLDHPSSSSSAADAPGDQVADAPAQPFYRKFFARSGQAPKS